MLQSQKIMKPPYSDLTPTIEWQVCGRCNYDCTYCIQSRKTRVGAPEEETVAKIIDGFAALPGVWEVKMSGGEPFAFAGLMRWVIPGLVAKTPHRISILTNFSAPPKVLEEFCRLTGERLRITSASLHLEFTDPGEFLAKAKLYRAYREAHNPHSSFVVNSVLVPGKLARQLEVKAQVEAEGFRYFPQLMKVKGSVYPYDARDVELIERLTGGTHDPTKVNRAPSYEGVWCEAGAWYFVVDQFGEAYMCRTGKRLDEDARLGSFVEGSFQLREKGGLCPYPICPCTVPANRGIVRLGDRPRPADEEPRAVEVD
jgi:MoaA/NifB/PqqE/SkfB family radical SAM enzyme